MKIKAQEIIFVVICLCAAIIAIATVAIVRDGSADNELTVDRGDPSSENEEYDVSVINFATLDDFMQISGIGEVKAGDIIAYRNALGGFNRVSQIKDVNGISDALYQRIIEYFYKKQAKQQITTAPEDITEKLTYYNVFLYPAVCLCRHTVAQHKLMYRGKTAYDIPQLNYLIGKFNVDHQRICNLISACRIDVYTTHHLFAFADSNR